MKINSNQSQLKCILCIVFVLNFYVPYHLNLNKYNIYLFILSSVDSFSTKYAKGEKEKLGRNEVLLGVHLEIVSEVDQQSQPNFM